MNNCISDNHKFYNVSSNFILTLYFMYIAGYEAILRVRQVQCRLTMVALCCLLRS